MKRNATKNDVLIGLGELEKLAGRYEATAKTLRKLSKGLRSVTNSFGEAKPVPYPKAALRAVITPRKRKGMSPAARKRLSEAMKARWADKKAQAKGPKLARRASDEAVGNGQKGQVA